MAFLFGSRAYGRYRPDSDVDIAVLVEPGAREKVMDLWRELERLLRRDVDLVTLNGASPLIAWEALRGIRLLVRNEGEYLHYMLGAWGEAEDFREFSLSLWERRRTLGVPSNDPTG